MHTDVTVPSPFGEPIRMRLYSDGRIAIEGVVEWDGIKQKAWIPIAQRAVIR